ncbi:MAG: nucleoside triphosphate pyrophosphohydrolase [Dehalococcoidales bacterium]|nr:MAG: nucleoside triphosphate pyrophosphohydrolase [Dehalococcoidales bacterium]
MSITGDLSQFDTLVDIIARLRSPEGCPWDREQTHSSLREYLLEECYEALSALDEGDSVSLCGELGDLLLQLVLHAQIATEDGDFNIGDVLTGINNKLIYRHPHVFGSEKVSGAVEVAHNWEALKQEERETGTSILASVPRQMPALGYSQAIQRRVAQVGFDWEDVDGVIDKLAEEVTEFKGSASHEEKEHEFGDLLFSLVNIARWLGIDSESALREANSRFYNRFTFMEDLCLKRGLVFADLSFDQQNDLWEEAKKKAEA